MLKCGKNTSQVTNATLVKQFLFPSTQVYLYCIIEVLMLEMARIKTSKLMQLEERLK